jgi:hypothetical protein
MARLTKPLLGVAHGEIYPRWYQAGDECPPELEQAAREIGALDDAAPARKPRARK